MNIIGTYAHFQLEVLYLDCISVATGGSLGVQLPPSVPRMGREIRANPMSFFGGGGTPYVVVWHFSLKVLFSCYNVCFLFKDANCALHSLFRNKENPHVLCFSYLERWVKIG